MGLNGDLVEPVIRIAIWLEVNDRCSIGENRYQQPIITDRLPNGRLVASEALGFRREQPIQRQDNRIFGRSTICPKVSLSRVRMTSKLEFTLRL